ncbi:MAG: sucrase ferredoxin [Actinomycetota bacterium]|nr:sucrase ferredoxin [Actinomycetota bacterium]MDQ2958900.1 sucrase ferredoxin [Actinomycetota bacterium]
MAERADRCRLTATARGDDPLGTAFPANRILLVEQPGGWGPAGLAASQFDQATALELIDSLGRQGIRVLAVRRPGRQPAPRQRGWGFADCRPGHQRMVWGNFDDDRDLLALVPGQPGGKVGSTDPWPVYAVCAHGTHDMCCAIEGRPVAAALDRLRPGQVWECSHVGGDRFAANVLILPTGQQYGRVTEVAELVAATEAGRVLPDLLRGQVGQPGPVQAALVHAQRELGFTGVAELTVLANEPAADGSNVVRLSTPDGEISVAVQRESGPAALLTCRAGGPRTPLSYRPLWLRAG